MGSVVSSIVNIESKGHCEVQGSRGDGLDGANPRLLLQVESKHVTRFVTTAFLVLTRDDDR